jgi:Immunity protein 52
MTEMDASLLAFMPIHDVSFDQGSHEFVDWLRRLRAIPTFAVDWNVVWAEGGVPTDLWTQTDDFLAQHAAINAGRDGFFSIFATEARQERLFDAGFQWDGRGPARAELDFYRADPAFGTGPMQYIEMIKVTTAWMRPQHLQFGPKTYLRLDHPLDVHRRGIGWIGWVPFALTAADVPEAVLVQQVNGGTIIMTWPDFWQAHPGARNDEAVRRTQDVEVRLNQLGVLPTAGDLATGNWGR